MAEKVYAFSDMMNAAMKAEKISYTDIQEVLLEKGIDIGRRRLSEYGRQVTTPPYEKALAISRVLGLDVDEEYLLESLRLNKKIVENNKINRNNPRMERNVGGSENNVVKVVSINYKGFIEGMTPEQVELKINERIDTLYGKTESDKARLGMYIRDLIRNDIEAEGKI